jgi:DNA-binding phage protein
MPKSRSYESELMGYLQDADRAIEYLNAALEEGDQVLFSVALQNVAKARGKGEDWVAGLMREAPTLNGNQLFFLLKELDLGLKSIAA